MLGGWNPSRIARRQSWDKEEGSILGLPLSCSCWSRYWEHVAMPHRGHLPRLSNPEVQPKTNLQSNQASTELYLTDNFEAIPILPTIFKTSFFPPKYYHIHIMYMDIQTQTEADLTDFIKDSHLPNSKWISPLQPINLPITCFIVLSNC